MILSRIELYARYGAILAVAVEWLSLLFFYVLNPSNFDGQNPLSYFATISQTRFIFSICYTFAAVSFWVFVRYHLSKHYRTPTKVFAMSMLGFAAVAIVPFRFDDPLSSTVHNVLALFFTVTFILGIYLMSRHNLDRSVKLVSRAAAGLGAILLLLFLFAQKDSQYILLFEIGSALACQFWMIWISFHAYKK